MTAPATTQTRFLDTDPAGAAQAAPVLLRGGLILAALWALIRMLPALGDGLALAGVIALGALAGLPLAWGAAVRRGHALAVWHAGGGWRAILGGAGLRVALALALGTLAAGLLVVRLGGAGGALWVLAGLAFPLTWALAWPLHRRLAAQAAGPHARRLAHLWAQGLAAALLTAAALLLAPPLLLAPDPGARAAPLVGQALALAHLWAGLEAFALGLAAEFGTWGRGAALLVAAAGLFAVFWGLAGLALAAALPLPEWRRALAPASDAAEPPPSPGRAGPAAGLAMAGVLMAAGLWVSAGMAALAPADRPAARVQVAVEQIGDAIYAAGTRERLLALRAAALAQDTAARDRLRGTLESGFVAMEGNVEAFLDDYYSLTGEYGRMWRWALGRLEQHMTDQLTAALHLGAPFAAFESAQAEVLAEARARAAELAAAEAALLAGARIDGANPARLRLTGTHAALPLPPAMLAADLQRAQMRWGVSAGTGLVAAALAQRVVAGLASRGLIAAAARMAVRAGGLLLAFGVDYALVKLDEYQNRDDFRAAILTEIAAQRTAALAALEPDAGAGYGGAVATPAATE